MLAGRPEAYGAIVERHHRGLFRVLLGILNDRHLAEDVAQEVWLIAYRRLESFAFRARFKTWLHRVAVREALSARNRARRFLARFEPFADPVARPAADETDREDVLRLLARLPAAERATFALHVEGFQYDEIAEALSCPIGTVGTRIHRARERLARVVGGGRASPLPPTHVTPVTPDPTGPRPIRDSRTEVKR